MRRTTVTVNAIVFVDSLLLFAIVPLLPAYARDLHLSTARVGLVVAVYSASVLVLAPPVGYLAERVGMRRMTIFGVALLSASTLAYGAADGFWPLMAARAAQGASSAISWTAGMGWLSAASDPRRRGRALSTAMAWATAGAVLGPLAGGPLGAAFGIRAPFVLLGLVAAGLTVMAVSCPGRTGPAPVQPPLRSTVARAARSPGIVAALVVTTLVAVDSGALDTLVPLQLGRHGATTAAITAVVVAAGVLQVATNHGVGRIYDRAGGVPIAVPAMLATAGALALMTAGDGAALVVAGFLISSPFVAAQYAVAFPLCADGADAAGIGHTSVFGLINLAWGLGFAAGPAAAAAIAGSGSDQVAYAALAALTVTIALALRLSWHSLGRSADHPA